MAMITFEDLPSTNTPLNAANLNNNFNEVLNLICPIGKVEVFFDNADHSNYLGFTWERTCVGRMPVGYNSSDADFDTIGETGGSKDAVVVSHTHSNTNNAISWVGGSGLSNTPFLAADGKQVTYSYISNPNDGVKAGWMGNANAVINSAGESGVGKNLSPYQVVAFWKRTA